jgi:hypothetical protein
MLADVAEVEGLEVAEMSGVEQYQYRHHLAVGKTARTVAMPLAWGVNQVFFQLWSKIFAEFVENTENFY